MLNHKCCLLSCIFPKQEIYGNSQEFLTDDMKMDIQTFPSVQETFESKVAVWRSHPNLQAAAALSDTHWKQSQEVMPKPSKNEETQHICLCYADVSILPGITVGISCFWYLEIHCLMYIYICQLTFRQKHQFSFKLCLNCRQCPI